MDSPVSCSSSSSSADSSGGGDSSGNGDGNGLSPSSDSSSPELSPRRHSSSDCSSSSSASSCPSNSSPDEVEVDDDASYFGVGAYYNIRHGIILKQISDDFQGLFSEEFIPAGSVVWKNRRDGPAESGYRKLYGSDIASLNETEQSFFIRYSYQNGSDYFISPLNCEEVGRDASNFWNHSCDPNTLPSDEDHWVAIRDIQPGEQLTIDYCTFDSNPFICIERCLCGSEKCRKYVRGDDYRIIELQERYRGHFLPYIQARIDSESEQQRSRHGLGLGLMQDGVCGSNNDDFRLESVRKWHDEHPVDVKQHNAKRMKELVERFMRESESEPEERNGFNALEDQVKDNHAVSEKEAQLSLLKHDGSSSSPPQFERPTPSLVPNTTINQSMESLTLPPPAVPTN